MQVAKSGGENGGGKGLFKAVFLVLAWFVIVSLAKDTWKIRQGFSRVNEAKLKLEQEEQKNAELKRKYDLVRTEEYKERLIRDQLNMQRAGETVAVLPRKVVGVSSKGVGTEASVENWKKWLKLVE